MLASVPLLISSPSFVKHIPSLPKEGIKGAFKDMREIYVPAARQNPLHNPPRLVYTVDYRLFINKIIEK
jgi:hypothetical protein